MITPYPPEAKPVHAQQHLSHALRARLCQWIPDVFDCGVYRVDPDKLAHPKATAIVAVYDDALRRLEAKTGPRTEAARKQISDARAPIAAALDLVNSIQADFGGPLGLELQNRIAATRARLASALAAKELAPSASIEAALIEVEKAWADIRELDRELASIYERLIVPWKNQDTLWPDLDALQSAEQSTRALEKQPAKNPSATQVHAAIQQGLEAPAHVAALFIAYETMPDHALLKWRSRAIEERA